MRLRERPTTLPLHSLSAEAVGGYLCCSRTSAMPSSPSGKGIRTTWVNGLPTIPTTANLAAESISPTTGPGREGKKRCAGAVWYASECDMTGGADPAQPTYQSPNHHSPPEHTFVVPNVTNVTLGIRPPIQPSAVGDRSLMWPYHITGTPGCSTPKVDNQHSLG